MQRREAATVRATFRDHELQNRLDRDGFVSFPFLEAHEVEQLRNRFAELGPAPGDPQMACHSSFHSFDQTYKTAVNESVRSVFDPRLRETFDRQRALPCNYIVKWPGGMSGFGLHQDLSLVDETYHRSVELWVALDPTNDENGQLWMVPGSHDWLPGHIRGIHAFAFPFAHTARRIIARHAVPVPLGSGEAVVFDHATLHFSPPNRSSEPRMVAITDLIPEEAQHVHYFGDGRGTVDAFAIDDSFWTTNNPFTLRQPPPRHSLVETIQAEESALTDADLDRLVADGKAVESERGPKGAINPAKPWCHRCGTTDLDVPAPNRWIGNVTLLCPSCGFKERRFAHTPEHVAAAPVVECREFVELGFTTMPILDEAQLAELRDLWNSVDVPEETDFFVSCNDLGRAEARRIDHALKDLLSDVGRSVLGAYRPFLASFISKAGSSGPMEPHQDLSYVDERSSRTVMIWIPLVDTDEMTGALSIVPGSHRWTTGLRPGGDTPLPTTPLKSRLEPLGVPVPAPAGTAVVFDNAVVHGSMANRSGTDRPAVAIAFAPSDVPLIHAHRREGGELECFEIDEEFFCTQPFRVRPDGYREIAPWAPAVESTDFEPYLPTPSVNDGASNEGTSAPERPKEPQVRLGDSLLPMPPRRALWDKDLDASLRRDGFAKLRVIDESMATRIRDRYGLLHGWVGQGFEPDLTNEDTEYRREVSSFLAEQLDETVESLFCGYRPFLRNYLCKWPGPDSGLYLHRDWDYVDERSGSRTYVVWIALEDVVGHNGQLRVLRRSHRLDEMLRGTNLEAAWLQHRDVIEEHLSSIPVKAGEAVILDNGTVHCSYPNNTDRPRLVAAMGMHPVDAPLIYWRRHDAESAERFDVTEEFFLTHTPAGLIDQRPQLNPIEIAPTGAVQATSAELAAILDREADSPVERVRRRIRSRFRQRTPVATA